jgi:hypothetical protein
MDTSTHSRSNLVHSITYHLGVVSDYIHWLRWDSPVLCHFSVVLSTCCGHRLILNHVETRLKDSFVLLFIEVRSYMAKYKHTSCVIFYHYLCCLSYVWVTRSSSNPPFLKCKHRQEISSGILMVISWWQFDFVMLFQHLLRNSTYDQTYRR